MSGLNVYLFGAPRVARDGVAVTVERRKTLALLAYLAAMPGAHGRATLATLLWPELDERAAHAGLRRVLVELRQTIGAEWLAAEGDQIALPEAAGLAVDARSFRAGLAAVARHSHARGQACANCLAELGRAAELYRGDFLAGFTLRDAPDFDTWQTCQTETFRLELAEALELLAEGHAGRAEPDRGLPYARRWLSLDPLCEPAYRCLMRLYTATGDRRAALQQYAACQEALSKELGIPPEPETTALYERIKAGLLLQRAPPGKAPPPAALEPPAAPTLRKLPAISGAFFGREAELTLIAARLADPACRLLTILGPGGIGKTSLALHTAAAVADHFPAGVCFVPLATVVAAELVPSAILQALDVPPRGSIEPQRQLLEHLAERRMLLVLDNFEHFLARPEHGPPSPPTPGGGAFPPGLGGQGGAEPSAADLLPDLLAAAPGVKLLITSRERLALRDEWLLPLSGLALPPDDNSVSSLSMASQIEIGPSRSGIEASAGFPGQRPQPAKASTPEDQAAAVAEAWSEAELLSEPVPMPPDLEAYAATQLFLHCARRVRPDLRPDADTARLIAHICRLVDGLPLAIELTAPWVRALPLADLGRRLAAGLDLLATTQRDVPPRHRSMRAAFDHSWRLLSAHERSILRQLAVFRGGCTAEAAEAVTSATLLDLAGLADKSWLRVEPSGRYDLHELVRQYCAEKLAVEHEIETGETPDQVRDRHCACFARLADDYDVWFRAPRNPDLKVLTPELANLEAACLHAIERRDADRLRQLHPLFGLSIELGRYRASLQIIDPTIQKLNSEWEAEAEKATDRASTTALLLAYLYWVRAWQYTFLDQFAEVLTSTTQSLALLERGERGELWQGTYVWLHVLRGEAICHLGDPAPAVRGLLEVSAYLEQADAGRWSPGTEAARLGWRAWVANCRSGPLTMLGRYEEAQRLQEQALALYQAGGGGKLWSAFTLGLLGSTLYLRGQYGEARQRELEALDIYQAGGSRFGIGQVLAFLAEIEAASGEVAQAREHFRRSLAIAHAIDRYGLVCFNLEGLGRLELEMGRPARAAEMYRESLAFGERTGMAHDYHTPIALGGLGRAALAMGDQAGASEYLRRSLRCPVYFVHDRIEAIATMAQVFAAEGDVLRAVELLAFAVAHPATAHRVRQPLARLLAELEAELPAELFAAATARGRARELDEVVAELVGEPVRRAADEEC